MAKPFTCEAGIAAPLLRDNVDTDAIIPSREMRSVGKEGLADGLFAAWRYADETSRTIDRDFVLNQPQYADAKFILSGRNFGCGSSREHAAWALAEYGVRAVIAESFNPIFFGNCVRNGIVPIALAAAQVEEIASHVQSAGSAVIVVDLKNNVVQAGQDYAFALEAEAREMLLEGLDPVALTMRFGEDIAEFRKVDQKARPWAYL